MTSNRPSARKVWPEQNMLKAGLGFFKAVNCCPSFAWGSQRNGEVSCSLRPFGPLSTGLLFFHARRPQNKTLPFGNTCVWMGTFGKAITGNCHLPFVFSFWPCADA